MKKLILASGSPRRKDILNSEGIEFTVRKSGFNEVSGKDPVFVATENAKGKAEDVFNSLSVSEKKEYMVLGADTVVFFNGKIYGKPKSPEDAKSMLKTLSGNVHTVVTGFALVTESGVTVDKDTTEVEFYNLSNELIEEYVSTGKPLDKAGAYGVQDGYELVKRFGGSYTNVVGLPKEKIIPLIKNTKE